MRYCGLLANAQQGVDDKLEAPMAPREPRKEQVGTADWAFVAFLIIITVIAAALTLGQIYLQKPQ
jgi:hypothetical protein